MQTFVTDVLNQFNDLSQLEIVEEELLRMRMCHQLLKTYRNTGYKAVKEQRPGSHQESFDFNMTAKSLSL